jgi:hypothetical protein
MGLPDITPGINTAICFDASSAAEAPPVPGRFAPHPVSAKIAEKTNAPKNNPFLKNPDIIAASGIPASSGTKKAPDIQGLCSWK